MILGQIVNPRIHLIAAFFLQRLERTFVAQFSFLEVFFVFEEHVPQVVIAVRVVLVQIYRILVRLNSLLEIVQ